MMTLFRYEHPVIRLILTMAMTVLLSGLAAASPIVPQFYRVRVSLSDGTYAEGYSWGISWIGGASIQERKVKRVVLEVANETVIATFFLFEDGNPVVSSGSKRDESGIPRTMTIGSAYEVFHKDIDFYWVREVAEYPLGDVVRIDTLEVVGQGVGVTDPRGYMNLREPFIVVEDCRLGCQAKLYSKDDRVTKEMLQELWDQHLACGKRSSVKQEVADRVQQQYRIEWIVDPFCYD